MIGVIIQARMGSSRMPGKTMSDLCGKPMLAHVLYRAQQIPAVEFVGIATTTNRMDDIIARFAEDEGVPVIRGSELDVLDRFYHAAREWGLSVIVRVTPDCPLLDPQVSGRVLKRFADGESLLDYVSNISPPSFPDGLDTEVFSFGALEKAWSEAQLASEREHVTVYFSKHPELFHMTNVASDTDDSGHRWTVDYPRDLEFVRAVVTGIGSNTFNFKEVLRYLADNPNILSLNHELGRNEGYYSSLMGDPSSDIRNRTLVVSEELQQRAKVLIPSATQTFSKGPTQFVQGVAPSFLDRGEGSHVWDVDGNEYIDYILGLAPVILGYNYPSVTEAAYQQMKRGVTLSLPHPLEVEVSELLVELIPCAEMVRFGKNGSDATSGAVRVARAYTGRDIIACCGYHGWQDWYVGTTTRNLGVPSAVSALTKVFSYNDLPSLERIFAEHPDQVAAVIMEPFGTILPNDGFLRNVRDLAHREGAVLIFDEIMTGFRVALGGAQEYFGVEPDIACFGKAMGNGYPISAVLGHRDIMQMFDQVFFSFTFGGEALSLAAAKATIIELQGGHVIPHLWRQGEKLQDGFNVLAGCFDFGERIQCVGLPPRTVINFVDGEGRDSLLLKSLFQQEVIKRGVLSAGYHNLCYSHSDQDVDHTLHAYRSALEVMATAIDAGEPGRYLDGEPVQPVFRQP